VGGGGEVSSEMHKFKTPFPPHPPTRPAAGVAPGGGGDLNLCISETMINLFIFSEMLENTSPTNNVVLVVEWCLKNIVTMKKPFVLCFRLKKIFLQREHNLFDIGFEKPLFQQTIMCLPNISKRI
jgi:hypothetical protein